jgi:hypothetical protein
MPSRFEKTFIFIGSAMLIGGIITTIVSLPIIGVPLILFGIVIGSVAYIELKCKSRQ